MVAEHLRQLSACLTVSISLKTGPEVKCCVFISRQCFARIFPQESCPIPEATEKETGKTLGYVYSRRAR